MTRDWSSSYHVVNPGDLANVRVLHFLPQRSRIAEADGRLSSGQAQCSIEIGRLFSRREVRPSSMVSNGQRDPGIPAKYHALTCLKVSHSSRFASECGVADAAAERPSSEVPILRRRGILRDIGKSDGK